MTLVADFKISHSALTFGGRRASAENMLGTGISLNVNGFCYVYINTRVAADCYLAKLFNFLLNFSLRYNSKAFLPDVRNKPTVPAQADLY